MIVADKDKEIIEMHTLLGDQIMRLDMLETRVHNERNGNLYVSSDADEKAAVEVVMELCYIALETK